LLGLFEEEEEGIGTASDGACGKQLYGAAVRNPHGFFGVSFFAPTFCVPENRT